MTCDKCNNVVERDDVPHVIRACVGCGRKLHIVPLGEHGRGIKIEEGDQFIIPAGWIKLSMNPLKATGRLYRPALDMLAKSLFLTGLQAREGYVEAAKNLEHEMDGIVNAFPPLSGLDINNQNHAEKIFTIMQSHESTPEYWAFWVGQFLAIARGHIQDGDAIGAAWATAFSERCRSMLLFKQQLEDVVWMGNSVKRILDVLGTWDAHRQNADEEFWQLTFNENSYVISQIFAVPIVFIKDKAYVGGMILDRTDARFVDYLFSTESSREAVLIEIKTPTTPLLAAEYRGNRPPSRDLSGSVVQVLNYRAELARNLRNIIPDDSNLRINAFAPRCTVIIGNSGAEFADDPIARRSFELFRTGLKDVEIITYDELFRKVEILAELFNLKRTSKGSS